MIFKLPETRDGDKEKGEERRDDEKFKGKETMNWWVFNVVFVDMLHHN